MNRKHTVLVVDDDRNTREGLAMALSRKYSVLSAESAAKALVALADGNVDVLISDVRMPGMDGLALLQRALASSRRPACIMLTAYGNVETAVEAMKRGAFDFLTKPFDLDHLELLVERAIRSRDMESENVRLRQQLERRYGLESMIGDSPAMHEVLEVIRQSAPTQATVLIQGESGTGKELVAHAICQLSPRAAGPFIVVNCAALAPTLLESELFGHEKGAFTGATERRRGRFELADGGTLFLDEISEVEPALQVKLLRVLEERAFERVGGQETIQVDIRLIAATNRDLRELVAQGKFREDLYFRLDVVNIHLPPLRDRIEDVPLLCRHFLDEFNARNGKAVDSITPEAMNILMEHAWPGNVRELRNAIEKMVVLSRGAKLTVRDLPANIRGIVDRQGGGLRLAAEGRPGAQPTSIRDAERALIEAALKRCDGNRTRAAKQLGISRRTMHRRLRDYGLEKDESPPAGPAADAAP